MMKRVGFLMPGQVSDASGRPPWCSTWSKRASPAASTSKLPGYVTR